MKQCILLLCSVGNWAKLDCIEETVTFHMILETFEIKVQRESGEERCVTTLKTAV